MTVDTGEATTEMDPFDRGPLPEDLVRRAADKGWPAELLARLWATWSPAEELEWFLTDEQAPTGDELLRHVDTREKLMFGTLRRRHAQESDNAALADLVANAPEEIDDWEITVERSPDAFAQFRLQDRVDIRYLEDRGVGMAMSVVGGRNCLVAGEPAHVAFVQSYRVRQGFRGSGYSRLVTGMDFPAGTPSYNGQVAYVRTRNAAAVGWMQVAVPHAVEGNRMDGDVPGTEVRVEQLPARTVDDELRGRLRAATRYDLSACVALINRTHSGLDLFRPYSEEWLADRLDEWSWAPKGEWHQPVYAWGDFRVLERDGGIVACGGVWDRGRNLVRVRRRSRRHR